MNYCGLHRKAILQVIRVNPGSTSRLRFCILCNMNLNICPETMPSVLGVYVEEPMMLLYPIGVSIMRAGERRTD